MIKWIDLLIHHANFRKIKNWACSWDGGVHFLLGPIAPKKCHYEGLPATWVERAILLLPDHPWPREGSRPNRVGVGCWGGWCHSRGRSPPGTCSGTSSAKEVQQELVPRVPCCLQGRMQGPIENVECKSTMPHTTHTNMQTHAHRHWVCMYVCTHVYVHSHSYSVHTQTWLIKRRADDVLDEDDGGGG